MQREGSDLRYSGSNLLHVLEDALCAGNPWWDQEPDLSKPLLSHGDWEEATSEGHLTACMSSNVCETSLRRISATPAQMIETCGCPAVGDVKERTFPRMICNPMQV